MGCGPFHYVRLGPAHCASMLLMRGIPCAHSVIRLWTRECPERKTRHSCAGCRAALQTRHSLPRLFPDKHIESPRMRRLYRTCQRNEVHTGGEVLPNPITEPFFSLLSHPAAPSAGFLRFGPHHATQVTLLSSYIHAARSRDPPHQARGAVIRSIAGFLHASGLGGVLLDSSTSSETLLSRYGRMPVKH